VVIFTSSTPPKRHSLLDIDDFFCFSFSPSLEAHWRAKTSPLSGPPPYSSGIGVLKYRSLPEFSIQSGILPFPGHLPHPLPRLFFRFPATRVFRCLPPSFRALQDQFQDGQFLNPPSYGVSNSSAPHSSNLSGFSSPNSGAETPALFPPLS